MDELTPTMQKVYESAAKLQTLVPDAILVGGSAAIIYARHRDSFDHDHVVANLVERYQMVVDAIEASGGWATSVRASKPPVTLLGSLDGVEAGLRALRRSRPLETAVFELDENNSVVVPTAAETLRIKAYLVVDRNAVRDYLDVVALVDALGFDTSLEILRDIDSYYTDRSGEEGSVLTQLVLRLANPEPKDPAVTEQLASYKALSVKWHEWSAVTTACVALSLGLTGS
jgi:hypothetical protein